MSALLSAEVAYENCQPWRKVTGEAGEVRLEFEKEGKCKEAATENIVFPAWSAHFTLKDREDSKNVKYRVRHGKGAFFEGAVREDPKYKKEIVIANPSWNSSRTTGLRSEIIEHPLCTIPTRPISRGIKNTATLSMLRDGSSSASNSAT